MSSEEALSILELHREYQKLKIIVFEEKNEYPIS